MLTRPHAAPRPPALSATALSATPLRTAALRTVSALAVTASLAGLLGLSGCGGGSDATTGSFKPPTYAYLTKLRLNVGDIRIEDQVPPPGSSGAAGGSGTDLAGSAPFPPDQAMRQMAEDRLVAAGNSGTAVFTIDQASITGQPGGALDGTLAAHIDIIGAKGGHTGYAEAHVSRQFVPGSDTDNNGVKGQLYTLTNQMMSDMNVEFEYQLRRTLGDWLLDASGAPIGATVEQQSLAPPGAGPSGPAAPGSTLPNSVGAPVQLAPPPGTAPPGQAMPTSYGPTQLAPAAQPPAAQMSPPPGFLRLPNGDLATIPAAPGAAASTGSSPATPNGY